MGRFERGLAKIPPRESAAVGHPPTDGPAAAPVVPRRHTSPSSQCWCMQPPPLTLDELVDMGAERYPLRSRETAAAALGVPVELICE